MADSSCPEKAAPVLIVGAGTWGTSIAYRLAKRGYTSITVLDSDEFPSSLAAGNDQNKILEEPTTPPTADQEDEDYAWSTLETLSSEVWRTDPVYTPHYHPTGFIYAAVGDEAWAKVRAAGLARPDVYEPLNGTEAFRQTMPDGVLTGDLAGWKGFIRRRGAGWVEARDVLLDVHAAAAWLGVTFVAGSAAGCVEALLYDDDEDGRRRVVGARTADGRAHRAHTTVLAAGAGSVRLLDFEKQLRPTAWTLAHVPLAADEAAVYAELPVLFGADRGFFISPPASQMAAGTPELKVCDEHPGYVHLAAAANGSDEVPQPWARDAIPRRSAEAMRALLQATVPQLAGRPLRRPRLCWDADTADRLFLIGRHPTAGRLVVAAGGSGNGFMNSPAVGVVAADLLEGRLDARLERILGWRPATAAGRDWLDTQGRFGGPGRVVDLGEIADGDWMQDPIE